MCQEEIREEETMTDLHLQNCVIEWEYRLDSELFLFDIIKLKEPKEVN